MDLRERSGIPLARGAAITAGVEVHDLGLMQCGIVSFTVARQDARAVREALHAQRINVRTSSLFSTRLDMAARVVRAGAHLDPLLQHHEEVDRLCAALVGL